MASSSDLTYPIAETGLWRFRWLLSNLVSRNLRTRHRQSVLGFAWNLVSPLLTMTILTVIFAQTMGAGLKGSSFALYVITGLLPWNLFSSASSQGLVSITTSRTIIRKVYVPKALFPLAAVLSSYVGFILSLVSLVLMMIIARPPLSWSLLLTIIPTLQVAGFAFGISMTLATAHVFFRDVRWFYESALLAGFYITPIFYTPDVVGKKYSPVIELNPLFPMIRAFRNPILYGQAPAMSDLVAGSAFTLAALVSGWIVVRQYEQRLINYL